MLINLLKSKLHRATVTGADLEYEGSISIDPKLCDLAKLNQWEQVDIYNCNNGERFTTYVIYGNPGEICLNGAAARLVSRGDKVIIAAYCAMKESEAHKYTPEAIFLDDNNEPKEIRVETKQSPHKETMA